MTRKPQDWTADCMYSHTKAHVASKWKCTIRLPTSMDYQSTHVYSLTQPFAIPSPPTQASFALFLSSFLSFPAIPLPPPLVTPTIPFLLYSFLLWNSRGDLLNTNAPSPLSKILSYYWSMVICSSELNLRKRFSIYIKRHSSIQGEKRRLYVKAEVVYNIPIYMPSSFPFRSSHAKRLYDAW